MNKIRINQLGYAPGLPKRAALLDQTSARLLDEAGQELRRFDGCVPGSIPPPATGGPDRSGPSSPRRLLLCAGGESRRIRVERRPYSALTGALVKGLYYQRCGCALEAAHAGPPTPTRPATRPRPSSTKTRRWSRMPAAAGTTRAITAAMCPRPRSPSATCSTPTAGFPRPSRTP